jgi:predicted Fe-Mo cluster-binding NifX family protein
MRPINWQHPASLQQKYINIGYLYLSQFRQDLACHMLLLKAEMPLGLEKKRGISRSSTPNVREVMVRAAFASWNDRIAPVFDAARWIQLVETEDGLIVSQNQTSVESDIPNQKAARLAELEVGILVCGAISRHLQDVIRAYGIEVISFKAGNLQDVIRAWLCGRLAGSADYAMPGCPATVGRRIQRTGGALRREREMRADRHGKGGPGRRPATRKPERKRMGRGVQGRGRSGGTVRADRGAEDSRLVCICPQCGNREAHERGVPCMQKRCALCGGVMTGKQEQEAVESK